MPDHPVDDPRAACVVVALLTARRAGVRVDVAALLAELNHFALFGGFLDVAEALLEGPDAEARLAGLGLSAALRVHGGGRTDG